jgi:nucleoside-triphosphatase THEP1
MVNKKAILLTGDVRTGKTTVLFNWTKQRNDVAGILTPVVNEKRMFYSIVDKIFFEMEAGAGETEVLQVGRFKFSSPQFAKADAMVTISGSANKYRYLVIDEIGPLELIQQKGFWDALNLIIAMAQLPILIIVVRQSFCNQLEELLDKANFHINRATVSNVEEIIASTAS